MSALRTSRRLAPLLGFDRQQMLAYRTGNVVILCHGYIHNQTGGNRFDTDPGRQSAEFNPFYWLYNAF